MARYLVTIVIFASLMAVAQLKGTKTFKKISGKDVTANSTTRTLEYGSVRMENCGPPASFTITPYPPVYNQLSSIDIIFTAAHTLIDGELSYYMNTWPFELHFDICEYMWQQLGIKVCPLEKGETYRYQDHGSRFGEMIYLIPNEGHVIGNVSGTNDFGDVILCASFDAKLPIVFETPSDKTKNKLDGV